MRNGLQNLGLLLWLVVRAAVLIWLLTLMLEQPVNVYRNF